MTRYVAIGDSTVEGLEDPGPGGVYVGWADRLAHHLSAVHPDLTYANLAIRGLTAREVRQTQLSACAVSAAGNRGGRGRCQRRAAPEIRPGDAA